MRSAKDALVHTLHRKSFSTDDLWERESLMFLSRDSNLMKATSNIMLHVRLRTRLYLEHITFYSCSFWNSHRTHLASLSSNFLVGASKGKWETTAWTTDSMFVWDKLTSSSKMTLFRILLLPDKLSENVTNRLLHDGFIILLIIFINIQIHCNQFVCQH